MPKQRPIDLVAAYTAKLKQANDEALSRSEQATIRNYDRWIAVEVANTYLRELPKGTYCELSGRQQKVIDEQAIRYDVPIGGSIIDLRAVLTRFHDLLADWGPKAEKQAEIEQERLRQNIELTKRKIAIADSELHERENRFVTRAEVCESLSWLASRLRTISERLGKRFGPDAQKLLNEGVQQIEDELMK